jgi:hypothetical protein
VAGPGQVPQYRSGFLAPRRCGHMTPISQRRPRPVNPPRCAARIAAAARSGSKDLNSRGRAQCPRGEPGRAADRLYQRRARHRHESAGGGLHRDHAARFAADHCHDDIKRQPSNR